MPNHIMAAYEERNEMIEPQKAVYDWACDQMKIGVDTVSPSVSIAARASEKINFTSFSVHGHKCSIPEEEKDLIIYTSSIDDWLSISLTNGEMEKKTTAIQAVHEFLKRK
jgi:hypothetical protein